MNRARDFDVIVTITPPLTVLVTFLGLVLLIALVLKPRRSPGYLGRVLQRTFSLRLGCSVAFFEVLIVTVVGALLGGVVTTTIGVVVVALFWALILLSDKVVLYYLGCKKRVNSNETVCSRCGRKLKVPF